MNKDQIEGKTKQAEGKGQESWGDAKEKADETWEEAKDKLDDLGDKIGEIKDKLAKDTLGTRRRRGARGRRTRGRTESRPARAALSVVGGRFEQRGGLSTAPLAPSCGACGRRLPDAGHLADGGQLDEWPPATRRWHQGHRLAWHVWLNHGMHEMR